MLAAPNPAAAAIRIRGDGMRRLAAGFFALVVATSALIVLGALVRAHEAGLACPDWPLCFGEVIPEFDLKVAFEWSHRVAAGSISLLFAGLGVALFRNPDARAAAGRLYLFAAALLVVQILLGALTVWQLLAEWTVTSHLITGNAFNACLLLLALRLREGREAPVRPALPSAARIAVVASGVLLFAQLVLGGLVSSSYAGLACPEWPTCNGGQWFPSWRGSVGLHLLHRMNGYLLGVVLVATAVACRGVPRLAPWAWTAVVLGVVQLGVGIANVLLALPVEVTGLHSALAAALVLTLTGETREAVLARGEDR